MSKSAKTGSFKLDVEGCRAYIVGAGASGAASPFFAVQSK
jgi:hypothetical protein